MKIEGQPLGDHWTSTSFILIYVIMGGTVDFEDVQYFWMLTHELPYI